MRRVAGALVIGASLAACTSTTPDDGCVRDHGGVIAEYGAPPPCGDTGVDASDADAADGRADGGTDTVGDVTNADG